MTMFLIILFCLTCLFLMLVILIQKPKGGGLSAAFGGGGGADSVFGGKTGDMLTWFTTGCFVLFLVLGVLLTYQIDDTPQSTPTVQPTGNTSSDTGTSEGGTGEESGNATETNTEAGGNDPTATDGESTPDAPAADDTNE